MQRKINEDWLFCREGQEAIKVDLPHDAMIHEERTPDCINGANSGYFPGGRYRYVKQLMIEKEWLDKSVVLHFEAVYQNSKIHVNGQLAGSHVYGYTPFDVEISTYLKEGNNTIEVTVDNSLEPNCRWYSGSGIYRDVTLIVRDRKKVERLHIKTISCDPAVIEVDSDAESVKIFDDEKKIYEGRPGQIELKNARLWSGEDPYLYRCVARKGNDETECRFGIRKLEWNAGEGLLINGRSVLLRGGCIHHDHGVLGACEYKEAEIRRIRILKENGFNAIRMAHNPASQILLDVCDELGMYVMNESFDGWYTPKTYHDYSRIFDREWKNDLETMVESSFNHSSVIMYSVGNEVTETASPKGVEVCRQLRDYVHSLDESRPVTAGVNVLLNVYTNLGMGVYKEDGEYKAEPLKKDKTYKEKKTGSAFFNMMAQKLGDLMFFMSKGNKGDRACKEAAEALDIIGLNYASSRYDDDVKNYPDRMMVGSETMVKDLPYNWERVKKYPALIGDFVWSAWDYLGEACVGDWTYHSYKGLPLLAGQGMIDITGKPLASMAYMQIVWGIRKEPFIAVRPLNHVHERPSTGSWQFTNAIDSWSWEGYENEKAVVEVYADAYRARLSLNDAVVGEKRVRRYKAMFKVPYHPGTLKAEALDEKGNVISSFSLKTADRETVLNVRPEKTLVKEKEIVFVPIEFTDPCGSLKPYLETQVDISVEGGKLLGFGSALCKTDEGFDKASHHTYRGRALAVIQATDQKEIKITADSDHGHASATIEVSTK